VSLLNLAEGLSQTGTVQSKLNAVLLQAKKQHAEIHYTEGRHAYMAGRIADAQRALKEALLLIPRHKEARQLLQTLRD
jgi:hypothetical protein